MKFVNHLNLGGLQLQFGLLHPLATAPATPGIGQVYYDTAALAPRFWNGTVWDNKATDSALLGGQNLTYVLNRANHSGDVPAGNVSGLTAAIQAVPINTHTTPTANLAMGGFRITGLADPTGTQDAATMGWVQSQVQSSAAGIDAKPSVRFATTANDTLSGLTARTEFTPVAGDRILVKNQTTGSANGVYIAAAGAWTRATDADGAGELTPGAFWFVEEGATLAKTQWRLENTGTITIGTTALTINQFGAGSVYTGGNGITLTGNSFAATAAPSGGITVTASGIAIDTTIVARKYSTTIGDGTATSYTVTHSLGTQDVVVSVREVATNNVVIADVTNSGVNAVAVSFGVAATTNQYRVTVIG